MAKKNRTLQPDEPLFHADHARPRTRRQFLQQGFIGGSGLVVGGGVFSLFANPREAHAALSSDIQALGAAKGCPVGGTVGASIPFICFDLAGGANMVGSNVLAGTNDTLGSYMNSSLSAAGYSKMGIPGDMLPGQVDASGAGNGDFTNTDFGLPFHSDSGFVRGMLEKAPSAVGNVDGTIIPARSGNDTANNPHNPMYGIAKYAISLTNNGAGGGPIGDVTALVGSQNSDSGGRSMAPGALVDLSIRPTKVDRPSDVTGLVDTGNLTGILSDPSDVVAVMESITRLSDKKMALGTITADAVVKDLVNCGYINAADIADKFAGTDVNPDDRNSDGIIVGGAGIFSEAEFDGDREFRKTASVMKMVVDGHAGAGTIAMGGYDYHTGNRSTGELRDLRAGRCIGAVLEYAARKGSEVMVYVFSDGSLASNGTLDNSTNGRGKGVWTGDNSSTAASFFLHYSPTARVATIRQQIGSFSAGGSVVVGSSPASNNVNLLVNTVILNYMLLNGNTRNDFATLFPNNGLGNLADVSAYNDN